jgi:pantothenate kinase-related protein Tda10
VKKKIRRTSHVRGPLTITITGRAESGKSYLARYLALMLARNGHDVHLTDIDGQDFADESVGRIMNKIASEQQPILIQTQTTGPNGGGVLLTSRKSNVGR